MTGFRIKSAPAPETTRFLEQKGLKPSFHWKDVAPEEHAVTLTVAKTTKADVLLDIRQAAEAASKDGKTVKQFQDELEPLLRSKGWWGTRHMIDPKTGEAVTAQLGSPRRLRTIYWANMRSARAAGTWERAQRTKGALPYFLYRLGPADKHRPHHENKNGIILPVDHPFWNTWFPPNGWMCVCWVRQVSESEAARLGGPTEAPEVPLVEFVNERTGERIEIPEGVDPGWHSNPGRDRARNLINHFNTRLEETGAAMPETARRLVSEFWASGAPSAYANMAERVHMPVAYVPKLAERLNSPSPLVVVSSDTVRAKTGKHGAVQADAFAQIQEMLESGTAIDRRSAGKGINFWMEGGDFLRRAVLRQSADGFLYVSTFFVSSANLLQSHLDRYGQWRGE